MNVFCDRLLLYGFLEEVREFSAEAVNTVGQELAQDDQVVSGGRTARGGRSILRVSHAMEQRLVELEGALETVLKYPEWQDIQMDRLERRILQLESAIQPLRHQLVSLDRRLDDLLSDEATTTNEPPPS